MPHRRPPARGGLLFVYLYLHGTYPTRGAEFAHRDRRSQGPNRCAGGPRGDRVLHLDPVFEEDQGTKEVALDLVAGRPRDDDQVAGLSMTVKSTENQLFRASRKVPI